ncbi:hypothetical protein GCM10009760_29070 [Kitasatospora kazusensis]|uniref:Uncharacterized protein n=1 Tax=Kitasatospora kazusensis TaxID=407974 RepID=A0ABN2ZJE0_9ACTN
MRTLTPSSLRLAAQGRNATNPAFYARFRRYRRPPPCAADRHASADCPLRVWRALGGVGEGEAWADRVDAARGAGGVKGGNCVVAAAPAPEKAGQQ